MQYTSARVTERGLEQSKIMGGIHGFTLLHRCARHGVVFGDACSDFRVFVAHLPPWSGEISISTAMQWWYIPWSGGISIIITMVPSSDGISGTVKEWPDQQDHQQDQFRVVRSLAQQQVGRKVGHSPVGAMQIGEETFWPKTYVVVSILLTSRRTRGRSRSRL